MAGARSPAGSSAHSARSAQIPDMPRSAFPLPCSCAAPKAPAAAAQHEAALAASEHTPLHTRPPAAVSSSAPVPLERLRSTEALPSVGAAAATTVGGAYAPGSHH